MFRILYSKLITAIIVIKAFKNWPLFFLYYFKILNKKELVVELRNKLRFKILVDQLEWAPIIEIYISNVYDIKNIIKDNSVVVDIGANIGDFSLNAARMASKIKVYSYEPVPSVFKRLTFNIRLNNFTKQIIPHKLAVAHKRMQTVLYYPGKNGKASNTIGAFIGKEKIRANEEHRFIAVETIQTVTLSDVFKDNNLKRIDLLKMDCEGSEFEILHKTPPELFKKINNIIFEYHRSYKLSILLERLTVLGYVIVHRDSYHHIIYAKNKLAI